MNRTRLTLLLAIAYAMLLPALLPADTVVEEIVARVNNEIITRSEYVRSRDQLKQEVQQQEPSNADRAFTEKQGDVLRDLIDQQLLLQKGKDLGITGDTELIKKLDEMRKQMNLDSMEDLEKAAQAQGASYEEFKQNLRNQIITQRVIGQEVGSKLSMNKDEVAKFYNEHRAEMDRPEAVRLSEILIAPKAPAKPAGPDGKPEAATEAETAAALAAAQSKAQDLLEQIHKGANFADLAKKNSDGPSAKDGGDLSYFNRGTLAKELEDKVFALKAGRDYGRDSHQAGLCHPAGDRAPDGGHSHAEGSRAAHPGRLIHAEAAARAARVFDNAARTGLHRRQARLRRHGRERKADQAG